MVGIMGHPNFLQLTHPHLVSINAALGPPVQLEELHLGTQSNFQGRCSPGVPERVASFSPRCSLSVLGDRHY